jgi:hypothetical protein
MLEGTQSAHQHARITMRLTKTLGMAAALVLSAVVGGTLIGSALATDDAAEDDATTTGADYCDTFLDELAGQLGTTRDGLTEAGRAAALATVDAALAAGDLSADRAATMRERIESADGDACAWFGHGWVRGFHAGLERGAARGFMGGDVFEAAADALGIESADLVGELRDAGSLQALAEAQGVSYDDVKASVLAAVQADLDAAVAEGLDQERADAMIGRLTEWLDAGGEAGPFGGFGGMGPGRHGMGPGDPFHGPWRDDGADDSDTEDAGA